MSTLQPQMSITEGLEDTPESHSIVQVIVEALASSVSVYIVAWNCLETWFPEIAKQGHF